MKRKLVVVVLLAFMTGVAAVGAVAATTPKFDTRFDCAKAAPASLLTSLAGGYGGTYTLKPKTHQAQVDTYVKTAGSGISHCDYNESGDPYPSPATAEGPSEVTILYGAAAIDFYKRDHAAAVSGVKCTNLKAQNPNAAVDPRQCGPVPVTGIGTQAYEAASYIAVLRGKVFLAVGVSQVADANGQPTLVSAALLESMANALLARLPAM